MAQFFKSYLVVLVSFLAMDYVWLRILTKDWYQSQLGHLLADRFNWWAVVLFYLIFCAGVVYFVVLPNLQTPSNAKVFLVGAFLGFLAYGAYDLTNWATLKDWPVSVVLFDMLWGMLVTGLSATIAVLASKFFKS